MRIFVVGLMMLGLAGCSFAPDYQRLQMELPQAWKDPGKGEQLDEQWWKRFDDSTLNALVQEALIANRDIAAAVARVDYARAQLGVARAELLPLLSGQAQGTQTWVETAKTALYQTRISRDAAESALEALLGRSPKDIMDGTVQRGMTLESIPTPPVIPAGVPSDLLERRPDIQQAEMSVKSANANIGVAKAAWFPAISLTGLFGVVSPELHTLMSNPLQTWSYGGAASVPLLDFGRVKYGVEAAEAKQRESLATYEKTVQGAFKEMRDALTRQQEMSNVVASLERMVKELRLSVELANTRYDNGYSSYLEVLDAERSLFDSEMQLAAARSERLSSIVNVCLALGGGWK